MKKLLIFIGITYSLISCNTEKVINKDMTGHWVNEEFYNHLTSKKDLIAFTSDKFELIIPEDDTNYTLINLNGRTKSGALELYKKNHLVIKNYFGNYQNADIKLNDNHLEFINSSISEVVKYKKIERSMFDSSMVNSYVSYIMPFINKNYIEGTYQLDSINITFTEGGRISGLNDLVNYSLCVSKDCRNNNRYNTIFLANQKNEGYYYEYEQKNDSLYIFEIDKKRFDMGLSAGNLGVKYAMKKIK